MQMLGVFIADYGLQCFLSSSLQWRRYASCFSFPDLSSLSHSSLTSFLLPGWPTGNAPAVADRFSGLPFFAAYSVDAASIVTFPSGAYLRTVILFAGRDSRLGGWLQTGKKQNADPGSRALLSFAVLPRPVEMAMVLISAMAGVIVRIRVRAFRSVVALRRTVLRMGILGNVRGLIVMILSVMRHGGGRIIGRKWNVYMLLSWNGKSR